MTFPFDPNPTQMGIRSGSAGNKKLPPAGAFPAGGVRFSVHFLLLSHARHEAADLLRGFFFHACRDVRVHVQ